MSAASQGWYGCVDKKIVFLQCLFAPFNVHYKRRQQSGAKNGRRVAAGAVERAREKIARRSSGMVSLEEAERRTRRVQLLSRRRTRAISGRHLLRSTLTASKGKGIVHFSLKLDSRASEANTYKKSDCVKQQAENACSLTWDKSSSRPRPRKMSQHLLLERVQVANPNTNLLQQLHGFSGIIDRRLSLKQM